MTFPIMRKFVLILSLKRLFSLFILFYLFIYLFIYFSFGGGEELIFEGLGLSRARPAGVPFFSDQARKREN